MSLASSLRPVGLSFNSPRHSASQAVPSSELTFQHDPNYLQLQRMLVRYQNLILLILPGHFEDGISTYDLTPLQRQVHAELSSPLPYHRMKWLRNVESARNLLLALERQAQTIKAPRAKKEVLRNLTEKRQTIKRLKNRIEEIGREVETSGDKAWDRSGEEDDELLGERADEILAKMGQKLDVGPDTDKANGLLTEGKPVTKTAEEIRTHDQDLAHDRDMLFGSSLRKRQAQGKDTSKTTLATDKGATSGFSNLAQTERSLQTHAHEHEDLTSALVSMAAQLKQQSRAFQFSLSQDENFLNRAVEGLDLNLTSMQAASKNMAFLRRMSEEQGWLGRLKLYAIILGLWVIAVLLVFVGPKLRF